MDDENKSNSGTALTIAGIIFAFFPLMIVSLSGFISDYFNCTLSEGSPSECYALDYNIGDTLYAMFVFGWYSLLTIPLGFTLAIIGFLIIIFGNKPSSKKTLKANPTVVAEDESLKIPRGLVTLLILSAITSLFVGIALAIGVFMIGAIMMSFANRDKS